METQRDFFGWDRTVKLGRKMLVWPVAHHWAVKVGDTWYEVAGFSKNDKGTNMKVNRCANNFFKEFGGILDYVV